MVYRAIENSPDENACIKIGNGFSGFRHETSIVERFVGVVEAIGVVAGARNRGDRAWEYSGWGAVGLVSIGGGKFKIR